jgi:hypothetical protein
MLEAVRCIDCSIGFLRLAVSCLGNKKARLETVCASTFHLTNRGHVEGREMVFIAVYDTTSCIVNIARNTKTMLVKSTRKKKQTDR